MKKNGGQLVYSPSDLIRYMESPYSTWMDRYHLELPGELTPDKDTEEQKLVAETGNKHEKSFLDGLKQRSKVTTIERTPTSISQTLEAIKRGDEVIYQARLELAPFAGYADFLKRYGTNEKGQHLYEVWDTKLARKTKPYYLIQLCCYAEMLTEVQGVMPAKVRVALGSGDMPEYTTSDFFYYYRQLKAGFLQLMADFDPKTPPDPDPRADHGRWSSHAQRWLEERDHLVLVAGVNRSQIRKLNAAGITTVAQLARSSTKKVPKLDIDTLTKLADQARLQVETREKRTANPEAVLAPSYRVLVPAAEAPNRGLALLPPPSPSDVFFDMEGYPLAKRGLEYLFGASTRGKDLDLEFHDWWGHDDASEKVAFEGFIDWVHARWKADPNLHIYHYASYEVAAVRRLMGKHGTREDSVDDLLRNEVFVDLYQVVRQGLRIGESSYSIKSVERLYRGKRKGDVATAGESIVYYANWIESGEPRDWEQSPILQKIRNYNRDDCESTVQLYDWLKERQAENTIRYTPKAPVVLAESDPEVDARRRERADLVRILEKKIIEEKDTELKRLHTFFRHILEFHRREAKPSWWRVFERCKSDPEELKDDLDCIGDAQLRSQATRQEKRSKVFTYEFDPNQDTKLRTGDRVFASPYSAATLEIVQLEGDGVIEVKIGLAKLNEIFDGQPPSITSFIPSENVPSKSLRDSVEQVVTIWTREGRMPAALENFLRRQPPNINGSRGRLQKEGEDIVDAAVRCGLNLRNSTLCLQGPPGTGKTVTGASMILALVKAGHSVGITSNSHKAIENLLRACCRAGGNGFSAVKVGGEAMTDFPQVKFVASSDRADAAFVGGVIGGTAWLFARPEWVGKLDYLFVDEAGQVSLGNLVAMSQATSNLVMLGDQMQLEQPIQGSHPGETGQSALNYYLQGHATIPDTLGLFLPISHRLPPGICQFISEMIYEGRLQPMPGAEMRRLKTHSKAEDLRIAESGLVFLPVGHEGNIQASDEEVVVIKHVIAQLLQRTKINERGEPAGQLSPTDILVVAPYNMQVRRLHASLPAEVRVGSVDKFQGQEAEVVIVSMCSSFGEYGSRGLEFILDENRLNVALSRARTLVVVVGDARIATAPAVSISGMRRLNLYCRLVQDHAS